MPKSGELDSPLFCALGSPGKPRAFWNTPLAASLFVRYRTSRRRTTHEDATDYHHCDRTRHGDDGLRPIAEAAGGREQPATGPVPAGQPVRIIRDAAKHSAAKFCAATGRPGRQSRAERNRTVGGIYQPAEFDHDIASPCERTASTAAVRQSAAASQY